LESLAQSRAGACIIPKIGISVDRPAIVTNQPLLAATTIQRHFLQQPFQAKGVHDTAIVHSTAAVAAEVTLDPHVVVGPECVVGARTRLHPGVVLERGVVLGEGCELHAQVVIARGCRLGRDVVVHSGTVVGADGFWYATIPGTACQTSTCRDRGDRR